MSDALETPSRDSWYLRPGVVVTACVVLALVISALLVMTVRNRWRSWDASAREAVEREFAKIRAKGEPATLEELIPEPVPDGENAAVAFRRAFDALDAAVEIEKGRDELSDWEDCLSGPFEPHREKVAKALDLYADAMRFAREAAERPRCRFELEYDKGYHLELPHLANLRALARLFAARARFYAEAGAVEESMASIHTIFRLARAIEKEPILISQLVMLSCFGIGVDALQNARRAVDLPDECSRRLIGDLQGFDVWGLSARGMMGERVLAAHTFDQVASGALGFEDLGSIKPPQKVRDGIAKAIKPRFLREKAAVLAVMTRMVDATRLPPWEAIRQGKLIGAEVEADPAQLGMIGALLLPAVGAVQARVARGLSLRDAAVIGLSCELYKSKHARYPDKLDALVPEFLDKLPPDPFTGKPFVYKIRDNGRGFVIYSVGEDLKDDGGVSDRDAGKDDVAWEGGPGANKN